MRTDTMIPLTECCLRLGIDTSFVLTLEEHGIIETITIEQTVFLEVVELSRLEKFARFYHDLDINIPGIQAITHLLEHIEQLQGEISVLNNRLQQYE